MTTNLFSLVGSIYMLASSPMAHAACSTGLTDQIVRTERIVDSLRPDKAGQMRVFAVDGSEYTAGQASWMKGQLRFVLRACVQGDETSAASALHDVRDLLNAHHKPS
jgi:hypothetical protein